MRSSRPERLCIPLSSMRRGTRRRADSHVTPPLKPLQLRTILQQSTQEAMSALSLRAVDTVAAPNESGSRRRETTAPRLAQFIITDRSDMHVVIGLRYYPAAIEVAKRGEDGARRTPMRRANLMPVRVRSPMLGATMEYSRSRGNMHCVSKDWSSLRYCMSFKQARTDVKIGHVSGPSIHLR